MKQNLVPKSVYSRVNTRVIKKKVKISDDIPDILPAFSISTTRTKNFNDEKFATPSIFSKLSPATAKLKSENLFTTIDGKRSSHPTPTKPNTIKYISTSEATNLNKPTDVNYDYDFEEDERFIGKLGSQVEFQHYNINNIEL